MTLHSTSFYEGLSQNLILCKSLISHCSHWDKKGPCYAWWTDSVLQHVVLSTGQKLTLETFLMRSSSETPIHFSERVSPCKTLPLSLKWGRQNWQNWQIYLKQKKFGSSELRQNGLKKWHSLFRKGWNNLRAETDWRDTGHSGNIYIVKSGEGKLLDRLLWGEMYNAKRDKGIA